jgi:hypothetical protein
VVLSVFPQAAFPLTVCKGISIGFHSDVQQNYVSWREFPACGTASIRRKIYQRVEVYTYTRRTGITEVARTNQDRTHCNGYSSHPLNGRPYLSTRTGAAPAAARDAIRDRKEDGAPHRSNVVATGEMR